MKKIIATAACLCLVAGAALAQNAAPKKDAHRDYDQRARACKKQANEQGLKGDEAQSYIAKCMKPSA